MRRASSHDNEPPLVNIYGVGNRNGLGILFYWARGYDYKPQPEETYVKTYGQHRYFAPHSSHLRWPWWRRPMELYKWTRNADGRLHDVHHFYLWNDGTTPMALLHRMLITTIIRDPWAKEFDGRSLPERLHRFIAPYVKQSDPPSRRPTIVGLEAPSSSDESDDYGPPPPSDPRPVPLDWRPLSPNTLAATPAAPSEAATPPRVMVEMPVWGPAQEFKAAWETVLRPGDRCTYCASDAHVFDTKEGHPLCPRYHAGKIYTCQYRHCTADTLHCTKMCPVLHAVCSTCWTRGHTEEPRCEEWDEARWAARREDWEAVADLGLYTARRRTIWNFGFFYHRRFTPWPWPFQSYLHMMLMPVLRVLAILRDWANGIGPLPPTRPRPAYHDEPHPRLRKRPPPEESQYHPSQVLPPVSRALASDFMAGRLEPHPRTPPPRPDPGGRPPAQAAGARGAGSSAPSYQASATSHHSAAAPPG